VRHGLWACRPANHSEARRVQVHGAVLRVGMELWGHGGGWRCLDPVAWRSLRAQEGEPQVQGVLEQEMLVAASSSSSDAASDYWAGSSQQPPAQMVYVIELLVNKIFQIQSLCLCHQVHDSLQIK
jgi:hypothetical protein